MIDKEEALAIKFMEETSSRIEKNVDIILIEMDNIKKFIDEYKGDKTAIDDKLRKNEIIQRVEEKLENLMQ